MNCNKKKANIKNIPVLPTKSVLIEIINVENIQNNDFIPFVIEIKK